jgi:hypothetical protein
MNETQGDEVILQLQELNSKVDSIQTQLNQSLLTVQQIQSNQEADSPLLVSSTYSISDTEIGLPEVSFRVVHTVSTAEISLFVILVVIVCLQAYKLYFNAERGIKL